MASIKLHIGKFSNPGTESCDFRGDKFIGKEQGDHHSTVLEKDPASANEVELALQLGPKINAAFNDLKGLTGDIGMLPAKGLEIFGQLRGEETGLELRIGVWDD